MQSLCPEWQMSLRHWESGPLLSMEPIPNPTLTLTTSCPGLSTLWLLPLGWWWGTAASRTQTWLLPKSPDLGPCRHREGHSWWRSLQYPSHRVLIPLTAPAENNPGLFRSSSLQHFCSQLRSPRQDTARGHSWTPASQGSEGTYYDSIWRRRSKTWLVKSEVRGRVGGGGWVVSDPFDLNAFENWKFRWSQETLWGLSATLVSGDLMQMEIVAHNNL